MATTEELKEAATAFAGWWIKFASGAGPDASPYAVILGYNANHITSYIGYGRGGHDGPGTQVTCDALADAFPSASRWNVDPSQYTLLRPVRDEELAVVTAEGGFRSYDPERTGLSADDDEAPPPIMDLTGFVPVLEAMIASNLKEGTGWSGEKPGPGGVMLRELGLPVHEDEEANQKTLSSWLRLNPGFEKAMAEARTATWSGDRSKPLAVTVNSVTTMERWKGDDKTTLFLSRTISKLKG